MNEVKAGYATRLRRYL